MKKCNSDITISNDNILPKLKVVLFGNPDDVLITKDGDINRLLNMVNSNSEFKYYCDEDVINRKRFLIFSRKEKVHTLYKYLGGFDLEAVCGLDVNKEVVINCLQKVAVKPKCFSIGI